MAVMVDISRFLFPSKID